MLSARSSGVNREATRPSDRTPRSVSCRLPTLSHRRRRISTDFPLFFPPTFVFVSFPSCDLFSSSGFPIDLADIFLHRIIV